MPTARAFLLVLLFAIGPLVADAAEDSKNAQPTQASTIWSSAITGLIAGVVGSLVAPWVNWNIDVRRQRHNARRDLIKYARDAVAPGFNVDQFRQSHAFEQLERHLPRQMVAAVRTMQVPPDMSHELWLEQLRLQLIAEIARIERKWRLV